MAPRPQRPDAGGGARDGGARDGGAAGPGGAAESAPGVLVVTDSTASLPPGAAERWGVDVVPLEVAVGDVRYREGVDLTTADLLAALAAGERVTTSQPPPSAFAAAYARAAERGARAVVSVHLSGELSGTVGAARLAAAGSPVPVHVVDSGTVAMGLGFAVLAAAEAAGGGGAGDASSARAGGAAVDPATVADLARSVAASSRVLVVVDSLDHLRRGGRIGAPAAAVGTLLGMRPLLTVRGGRVEVAGTVRTRRAARERLLDRVAAAVAARPGTRVAVHHLGRPDLGAELAAAVRDRLASARDAGAAGAAARPAGTASGSTGADVREGERDEVLVADVSAVLGAHAGPGLLGVVVAEPWG